MDSVLRPRDIQARIRAGETPESVAAAAQTAVEKIMPYAAPVLAEREHVTQRAQRASIRRPAPSGGRRPAAAPSATRLPGTSAPRTSTPTPSPGTPGAARTAAGP